MTTNSANDRELVDRYLSGDAAAFTEIVRRYQNFVFNLCRRVVGAEAEDLTQEVFIRLLDKIEKWRGEAKFSTWLYSMAFNHCRDYLRSRKPEAVEVDDKAVDPLPGPDKQLESKEIRDRIYDAFMTLPVDFRAAVFFRDVEGCSYDEIAEILQIELGTVKSRISRARLQLAATLEQMRPTTRQRG